MRLPRFQTWITELVDANLPSSVKRIDWADSGINSDPGMGEHCVGLVFEAPDGGVAYLQTVNGGGPKGDNVDQPEEIVEGEPPAPVAPVELTVTGGHLRMADLETWLTALILNAQSRELASIEQFSTRPAEPNVGFTHRIGYRIKWHDGSSTTSFLRYTLAPGERRTENTEWRIKEAV
jgi:hypothetical protein